MKGLVLISIVGLSMLTVACGGDQFVDAVVIVNPTAFTADVDVTGGSRDGWTNLVTVEAKSEATAREVFDQGDRWVFRFTYSGYEQEIELSRDELDRARWRVTIPISFESELRQQGVPPPP